MSGLEIQGRFTFPIYQLTNDRHKRVVITTRMQAAVGGDIPKKIKGHVQDYYRHMIGQVQAVLDRGAHTGIRSSAGKQIAYQKFRSGRSHVPVDWKRLTEGYIKRRPTSRAFWKKRKGLSPRGAPLRDIFRNTTAGRSRLGLSGFGRVNNERLEVEWGGSISFPRLPYPLNRILYESFTSGRPYALPRIKGFSGMHSGITQFHWPESRRPFIARLSAAIGEEMRKELKSMPGLPQGALNGPAASNKFVSKYFR